MVNCDELFNPGVARKILVDQGVGALNKAMTDCGHVAKALKRGGQTIVKMDDQFDRQLSVALGWDGAANFLRQHGEAALNDELKRRGISHRIRVEAGAQVRQSKSVEFDPMFPGMGVKMDPTTARQVAKQQAAQAQTRKSVNGFDPIFGSMNVPLKK